jgi:NAD-dependent dihydropyrimidine dehydrogenase PreA subunit
MGTFLRWFGHSTKPGLRQVGSPGPDSDVLVTCNYSLTVRRVLRAVRGRDLWLLVAPSGGINVWCASCGGELTDHQVVSAVKTSMLEKKVNHRRLVLPGLSAPGMDRANIEKQTGFSARFGPARAADIGAYLDAGMKKTRRMQRADFSLRHRMDMLVSMNSVYFAPAALVTAIFRPEHLVHLAVLFWGLALTSYALVPWLPGRTGWQKTAFMMAIVVAGYVAAGWLLHDDPLVLWPWMAGGSALMVLIGLDLAGTTSPMHSDAERFMRRVGIRSMGSMLKDLPLGHVRLDEQRCTGCRSCVRICPVLVFDFDEDAHRTVPARWRRCFSCGACTKQCPEDALHIR